VSNGTVGEYVCVFVCVMVTYRVFHRFGQAAFTYGSSVLGSSQFSVLLQLPLKMRDTLCRTKYSKDYGMTLDLFESPLPFSIKIISEEVA